MSVTAGRVDPGGMSGVRTMHDLSKWFLRVMIVLGAIGFGTIYVQRNGWTIAEPPRVFDNTGPSTAAAPTPSPSPSPSASVATQAAVPAAAGTGVAFATCQPIGRTGRGELVYSMDCQQLPQAAAK
jgi:hypothetical protein